MEIYHNLERLLCYQIVNSLLLETRVDAWAAILLANSIPAALSSGPTISKSKPPIHVAEIFVHLRSRLGIIRDL